MASIKSQMTLNDGMSSVLKKITSALDATLNAFEQVQRASGRAVDAESIAQARSQLVGANAEIQEMAEGYRRAAEQEENLNRGLNSGNAASSKMLGTVKSIAATLGAVMGLDKLMDLSDQMTSTSARLSLMVDDGGSVTDLENKIMASAQRSRATYLDTAGAIASMGTNAGSAFSGNDELIAFMEQVNKQFVIGGASAQGQSAAMLQLTQAMAAGALRGEELNSILENAPGIARAIESYLGVAEGSIKSYAEQGLITSEVVKNALFSVADETNAKFESMPMTWAQVWTMMSNVALQALDPVLTFINWLANNIEIIGPLVLGVAAAFGIYLAATKGVEIATKTWTAVQSAFNAVMSLNPVFLIIMGIVLLIALIYAVVAAVNKVTGSSISATGVIVGALTTAVAFIWNLFLALLDLVLSVVNYMVNPWITFANFFGNLFNDPIGSIIHLFGDMADTVLGIIESIAKALDKVLGTDLASSVQGWRTGLDSMIETAATQYGNGSYEKIMDELNLSSESLGLSRWAYGDAWDMGYNAGQSLEDSIGGMFDLDTGSQFDYSTMASDVGSIAANTDTMADSLEVSSEQLEYLRDIAEREAVNRFTTAEVKIDMTGMTNRIDGNADLDGVLTTLTDGFAEALVTAAEGVHE